MTESSILFLPQDINVGYQNRKDTYSGKLAYVTYFDSDKKLRKEKSWESWRDSKIPNTIIENEPTSGFVLNKQVGGYSGYWYDNRQAYVRVYDPRGFEFEITPQNLMYILENSNSYKGKGLEGEFVYGWSGSELVLIPLSDPKFSEYKDYSDSLFNKEHIKAKDLKIGFEYKLKNGSSGVYMGKYYVNSQWSQRTTSEQFIFYVREEAHHNYYNQPQEYFLEKSSIGKNFLVSVISDEKVDDYLDILTAMQKETHILTSGGVSWIKAADLKLGHKYKLNNGSYGVYMGKHYTITDKINRNSKGWATSYVSVKSKSKQFVFYTPEIHVKREEIYHGPGDYFWRSPNFDPQLTSKFISKSSVSKFVSEDIEGAPVAEYEYFKRKMESDKWVVTDLEEKAA